MNKRKPVSRIKRRQQGGYGISLYQPFANIDTSSTNADFALKHQDHAGRVVWTNSNAIDQNYPKAIDEIYDDQDLLKRLYSNLDRSFPQLREANDFVRYGLSAREKQVLQDYTQQSLPEGYTKMNRGLRQYYHGNKDTLNIYLTPSMVERINIMDDIFRKAPKLNKPFKVYRGMESFSHEMKLVGPFMSTSLDKHVAQTFSLDYVLEIEIAAGTPILPLYHLSAYASEQEILLPRSGRVKLRGHKLEDAYGGTIKTEIIQLTFEQPSTAWIDALLTPTTSTDKTEQAINEGDFDNEPPENIPTTTFISSWETVPKWLSLLFPLTLAHKYMSRRR